MKFGHLGASLLLSLVGLLASQAVHAQDSTPYTKDAAKAAATNLGATLNPNIQQGIRSANPSATVPGFNGSPPQKDLFQGGQGQIAQPGANRVVACTDATDVECQAVNLMRNGPLTRPQFNLTRSDPLLQRGKSLTNYPADQIGNMFSAYQTCKTTTVVTAATFETEVCNEFSVNENDVCVMGQAVEVDPDHFYQCVETIQAQNNATCTMGRVVQVDADANYQCNNNIARIENYNCDRTAEVTIIPGTQAPDEFFNIGGHWSPCWERYCAQNPSVNSVNISVFPGSGIGTLSVDITTYHWGIWYEFMLYDASGNHLVTVKCERNSFASYPRNDWQPKTCSANFPLTGSGTYTVREQAWDGGGYACSSNGRICPTLRVEQNLYRNVQTTGTPPRAVVTWSNGCALLESRT